MVYILQRNFKPVPTTEILLVALVLLVDSNNNRILFRLKIT